MSRIIESTILEEFKNNVQLHSVNTLNIIIQNLNERIESIKEIGYLNAGNQAKIDFSQQLIDIITTEINYRTAFADTDESYDDYIEYLMELDESYNNDDLLDLLIEETT